MVSCVVLDWAAAARKKLTPKNAATHKREGVIRYNGNRCLKNAIQGKEKRQKFEQIPRRGIATESYYFYRCINSNCGMLHQRVLTDKCKMGGGGIGHWYKFQPIRKEHIFNFPLACMEIIIRLLKCIKLPMIHETIRVLGDAIFSKLEKIEAQFPHWI